MKYVININSDDISRLFYELTRPIGEPNVGYGVYPLFIHPVSGDIAFGFEDDEPVLVSHSWDGTDADELTTAIGLNPGQSNAFNNKLQSTIVIPQGQEPPSGYVLGRFPSSGIMNQVGTVRNQAQMEADGWFDIS